MFKKKEWEAILVAKVVAPDLYKILQEGVKDKGRVVVVEGPIYETKDGDLQTITVKARTSFGAAMEAIKTAGYYSAAHLGAIKYKIKSIKPCN